MGGLSLWHWVIVIAVVLLLFGPGRLGNLGRDLGKSIKEFKSAMSDTDVTPSKIENRSNEAASTTTTTVNQSEKEKV